MSFPTLPNFNEAAILVVFDKILSYAQATGRFDSVNGHEPKSAPTPGTAIYAAMWVQSIGPVRSSGLAATSGLLLMNLRVYQSFLSEPFDMIDPNVLSAVTDIMGALSGDFDFDGASGVRYVDLLGSSGSALSATAGYVEVDRKMYRVMTILVPVIINDMFGQAT
jgi:hypothetical protein